MREIKFRGMTEKGEWKQGLLTFMFGQYAIVNPEDENSVYLIDKETAGQYTGQYDPTATEFCEGDIIKDHTDYWEVKFFDGAFWIVAIGGNAEPELLCGNDYMEIIGNRYENPELLKEEPTC